MGSTIAGSTMRWDDPTVAYPLSVAWEYMKLTHRPVRSDAILTLGSFDPMAAVHAAALWHAGWAPVIIMSGGIAHEGTLLNTGWDRPEALVFADVAHAEGVPRDAILLEDQAQNTGENFTRSRELSERLGLALNRLLVVAKPYMTRRGYTTGRAAWPSVEIAMQCEEVAWRDYFARVPEPERLLRALVGDLHRIMVYPALGFQIEQEVPAPVRSALRSLVDFGFGDRLVPGYPA